MPQNNSSLWQQLSSLIGGGGGPTPFAQAYNPWGSTGAAQSAYAQGAGPNPAQFMPPANPQAMMQGPYGQGGGSQLPGMQFNGGMGGFSGQRRWP